MAQAVRIIGHKKNLLDNEYLQAQVRNNGSLQVVDEGFMGSDQDESSDPSYYGFVDKSGAWYIMSRNLSLGQFRYAGGLSGYILAWSQRDTLTYDYYFNTFPM